MTVMGFEPLGVARNQSRSEPLRSQQRISEVDQECHRNEGRERIVEDHDRSPSKPFADIGVADREREEAEREGEHQKVHHGMLLVRVVT